MALHGNTLIGLQSSHGVEGQIATSKLCVCVFHAATAFAYSSNPAECLRWPEWLSGLI
jgi:hypothetical protein